ncbi:MAG: hypothetical protein ACT4O6_03775 [Reyranella sp.]
MKHPQRWILLPAVVLVLGATAGCSTPAARTPAQTTAPITDQTTAQLKARCSQLIAYYDRWAVGRSNDSDGRRNHTRIGAEIDCRRGLYAEGIAIMEDLLRRKKLTAPLVGLPKEVEDED